MAAVLNRLQNGTVVLPVNTLSVTVTLANSVIMSQAFLVFSCSFDSASPSLGNVAGELTTPTLLTFSRGDLVGAPAITIEWYVAEFVSGITVQRGSLLLDTVTSANVPLSAVHLSSAFPLITATADDITYSQDDFIRADIINATTLQITVDGGTPGSTVKWQVIEFTDCIVQHGNLAWGTADLNLAVSINPVITNKAWLVFSYLSASGTATNIGQKMVRGQVASASQLVFDRDSSGQTMTLSWYLIEFTDNTTVQHGSTQFGTGELVKDTVISKVNRNQSIVTAGGIGYQGGKTNYIATDNPGVASVILDLTSSTNLQMTRGLTGSATADIAWFIIDFTGTSEIPPAQPQKTFCTPDPILRFTDGDKIVDILAPGSGWKLMDPYWRPQIAQYKGGGSKINPSIAPGQRLVHKEYDNVIETFPLEAVGVDEEACIATINELLSLSRQSADYWAESYEFDDVWIEAKPAGVDSFTGYAQIIQMRIAELSNVFGQPFFSPYKESVMDGLTLTVEREPLWRAVPPGEIIGPLYNLIRNPDFEIWNNGIADSQPDNWTDLETIQITGDNNQQDEAVHSGNFALRTHVGGSTNTGRIKGVTQVINGTRSNTEYTVIAWVRSDGVSNGVGRVLVTYSSQLEIYRDSVRHGWTLYTGKFTTGAGDTVSINCEILTTAANTDGTVYFDSLMLLEGDWQQEAIDGILPYMSSSHIVNHLDNPSSAIAEAGDINYVDVWGIPGTDDASVRLEVINNNTPTGAVGFTQLVSVLRVGMRRTRDVTRFDYFHDPAGVDDTTASSDDRITTSTLGDEFETITTKTISQADGASENQGRFRVLARVYDPRDTDPTMFVRLVYSVGTPGVNEKALNPVQPSIRGNWTMVNLTPNAAMVQETKSIIDNFGELSYSVQFRRSTGSDVARLDYVIKLPTDGGFLNAEINPALAAGNALIVDGTVSSSQNVFASSKQLGERLSLLASASGILIEFKGSLYFFGPIGGTDNVSRLTGNTWQSLGTFGGPLNYTPESCEVYNGDLYVSGGSSPLPNRLSASSDGSSWSTVATLSGTERCLTMYAFDGFLWLGTLEGTIRRWDNSSLVLSHSVATTIRDFAAYGNRLYAAHDGGVLVYDPTSGAWSVSNSASDFLTITTFNNRLYATRNAGGGTSNIVRFDGQTWTTIATVSISIISAVIYNEKVWWGGGVNMATIDKDENVDEFRNLSTGYSIRTNGMATYSGSLYFANDTATIGVYTISEVTTPYKVADYQLVPFSSPPQKRHRFIFSWDREGLINVVDDAALVGIGFVPRYLGLRGKG